MKPARDLERERDKQPAQMTFIRRMNLSKGKKRKKKR